MGYVNYFLFFSGRKCKLDPSQEKKLTKLMIYHSRIGNGARHDDIRLIETVSR